MFILTYSQIYLFTYSNHSFYIFSPPGIENLKNDYFHVSNKKDNSYPFWISNHPKHLKKKLLRINDDRFSSHDDIYDYGKNANVKRLRYLSPSYSPQVFCIQQIFLALYFLSLKFNMAILGYSFTITQFFIDFAWTWTRGRCWSNRNNASSPTVK